MGKVIHARDLSNYQRGKLVDLMFDLASAKSVGTLYRTVQRDLPRVLRVSSGTRVEEAVAYERLLLTGEFHGARLNGENNFRRYANVDNGDDDREKRKHVSLDDEVFSALRDFREARKDGDLYMPVKGRQEYDGQLVAAVQLKGYDFRNERERKFVNAYLDAFGNNISVKLGWKKKRLEAKEALDVFGTVAHKLTNKYTAIDLAAQGLEHQLGRLSGDPASVAVARKYLERIRGNLAVCIRKGEMLDSMASSGSLKLPVQFVFQKTDLYSTIREIIDAKIELFGERNISLDYAGLEESLDVECNSDLMDDVLVEVVNNVLHNTPDGERFVVSGGINDGLCVLRFRNTGIYRTEEEISKMFEDGYSNRADRTKSTGRGLTYVHGIVTTTHKGKLDVLSEETPEKYFELGIRLPVTH